jgi:hypothetical protein
MSNGVYMGGRAMGSRKAYEVGKIADEAKRQYGKFTSGMGKRKLWDKFGDLVQKGVNVFLPGVGNIADYLIDQISSRNIDVGDPSKIADTKGFYTAGLGKTEAEKLSQLIASGKPDLLSGLLQEGAEYLGSEEGEAGFKKSGESIADWFSNSFEGMDVEKSFGEELTTWNRPETSSMPWDIDYRKEGGKVPKYYGGGSVGSTPTISDYFNMQGKTLGGSNTQSISEKIGRI